MTVRNHYSCSRGCHACSNCATQSIVHDITLRASNSPAVDVTCSLILLFFLWEDIHCFSTHNVPVCAVTGKAKVKIFSRTVYFQRLFGRSVSFFQYGLVMHRWCLWIHAKNNFSEWLVCTSHF